MGIMIYINTYGQFVATKSNPNIIDPRKIWIFGGQDDCIQKSKKERVFKISSE